MMIHLEQGKTYRAQLSLPFLATFGMAKSRLEDAGFRDVAVYGAGGRTYAQGVWGGATGDYDMPAHIVSVWEAP